MKTKTPIAPIETAEAAAEATTIMIEAAETFVANHETPGRGLKRRCNKTFRSTIMR
jgi:hypothetical protein